MSVEAMGWAFRQPLSGNDKVVLLALADHARDDGLCWPGQMSLAAKAYVSERTVRSVLKKLEAEGYITREKRGGEGDGRRPDLTRLNMGQPATSSGRATGSAEGGQPEAHARPGKEPLEEPSALVPSGTRESAPASRKPKPVTYRSRRVPQEIVDSARHLLEVFNEVSGRSLGAFTADGTASPALKQIVGALMARDHVTALEWERAVRNTAANPPSWVDGQLMIGHVFGERAAEHALSNDGVRKNGSRPSRARANEEQAERWMRGEF